MLTSGVCAMMIRILFAIATCVMNSDFKIKYIHSNIAICWLRDEANSETFASDLAILKLFWEFLRENLLYSRRSRSEDIFFPLFIFILFLRTLLSNCYYLGVKEFVVLFDFDLIFINFLFVFIYLLVLFIYLISFGSISEEGCIVLLFCIVSIAGWRRTLMTHMGERGGGCSSFSFVYGMMMD